MKRPALALLAVAFAAAVLTVGLSTAEYSVLAGEDDPTVQRRFAAWQGGEAHPLHTARCTAPEPRELSLCSRQRYPRQAIASLDPRQPFRLKFSSAVRVEVSFWKRTSVGLKRRGARDLQVQCIDSACVDELRIPRDKLRVPRDADTMRVVLFGDAIAGTEIALR